MSKGILLPAVGATLALASLGCGAGDGEPVQGSSEEQELIGGTAESRWRAVGYVGARDGDDVLCGATLVAPNVVVTAAHCIHRSRELDLEFGVGEVQDGERYLVQSIHNHPEAHVESEGSIDLVHTLLLFDLAYLILDEPVIGVEPAVLSTVKPEHGETVQLVAYGPLADDTIRRKGVRGRVVLNAELASDSIVEIAPRDGGAVCHRQGDEGHAAVEPNADDAPILVGIYVGSVTQWFSDCKKYLQYLNGYEATFGHLAFYEEGIAAGAAALEPEP